MANKRKRGCSVREGGGRAAGLVPGYSDIKPKKKHFASITSIGSIQAKPEFCTPDAVGREMESAGQP